MSGNIPPTPQQTHPMNSDITRMYSIPRSRNQKPTLTTRPPTHRSSTLKFGRTTQTLSYTSCNSLNTINHLLVHANELQQPNLLLARCIINHTLPNLVQDQTTLQTRVKPHSTKPTITYLQMNVIFQPITLPQDSLRISRPTHSTINRPQ